MKQKFCQLALCIGIASVAAHASADTIGAYAGIGIGQSTVQNWVSKGDALGELDAIYGTAGCDCTSASTDDSDTGWKIYGGYEFTPNLAAEVSYLDLGEATAKASAAASGDYAYVKATGEATAITVDGVGKLEMAPWMNLFAKAGLYRAHLKVKETVGDNFGFIGQASDSETDSSTGLHIAIGANFNITQEISIRAEWERLSKVDFQDEETDIDLLSISAIYKF